MGTKQNWKYTWAKLSCGSSSNICGSRHHNVLSKGLCSSTLWFWWLQISWPLFTCFCSIPAAVLSRHPKLLVSLTLRFSAAAAASFSHLHISPFQGKPSGSMTLLHFAWPGSLFFFFISQWKLLGPLNVSCIPIDPAPHGKCTRSAPILSNIQIFWDHSCKVSWTQWNNIVGPLCMQRVLMISF